MFEKWVFPACVLPFLAAPIPHQGGAQGQVHIHPNTWDPTPKLSTLALTYILPETSLGRKRD